MEDIFTEVFVSTLLNTPPVLEAFAEWLGLEGEEIRIQTQCSYLPLVDGGPEQRPDIVIETESELCLIESKLESGEGQDQLKRYQQLLERECGATEKKGRLIYLTQYHDPKPGFDCRRWYEVYQFLKKQDADNSLVQMLIQYMEELGMNQSRRFSPDTLGAMRKLQPILLMMDEVLDLAAPSFAPFGKKTDISSRTTMLRERNQYVDSCWDFLVVEKGWNRLSYGFDFSVDEEFPALVITLWLNRNRTDRDAVRAVLLGLNSGWTVDDSHRYDTKFSLCLPLSAIVGEQDHISATLKWFETEAARLIALFQENRKVFRVAGTAKMPKAG